MFLKRITLSGFKSFADKVDFEFGPGVTCVVGPNGCGKSNVVDAFKWVLGEQSAKSLRGGQMLDMIFNGSQSRKGSGMAVVDLEFDNTDRSLPIDADTVEVTRRLYRSGESEYLVNKTGSRLRDIRELFLDTGVGTDAYCVIEQGRVASLLQSSAQERRSVFEEAAGISKYKARKKEAIRKLERTQQNLLRVADIIEEVEKRLRSVKLQAGKARNFKEYDERLRELRSAASMAEFHRLTQNAENHRKHLQRHGDVVTELRTKIDVNENESLRITARNDELQQELSTVENDLQQARTKSAATEERIEAGDHAIAEQRRQLGMNETQLDALNTRREELNTHLAELQTAIGDLDRAAEQQNATIAAIGEQDRELSGELTHAQGVLNDEKAGVIDLLRRTSELHNDIARLETQCDSLQGHKGRLSQRDQQISEELHGWLERKSLLQSRRAELDQLIETEMRRLEEKKTEAQQARIDQARIASELAEAKQQRTGLMTRQSLLTDLERRMEGVGTGVRQLLDARRAEPDNPTLQPIVGMVADLFEADLQHALVIEAAIGHMDQHLVVRESAAMFGDQERFRALSSRLSLICLDRLPPLINVRDFSDQPGYVARASDLARFPDELDALGRHLLGKTIVVDTLDSAVRMADGDNDGHRFVTLQGQVVEPTGELRLGPPSLETGLISRKSELRDIAEQLAEVEGQIGELSDQHNHVTAEAEHLDDVQQELRGAIHEAHTAKVEAAAALENVREAVDRLTHEQPLIAGEVAMIEAQMAEAQQRSSQSRETLDRIERENQQREQRVADHQQRIDSLTEQRAALRERLTEAKVRASELATRRSSSLDAIASRERDIEACKRQIETAEQESARCRRMIVEAEETVLVSRSELADLQQTVQRLDAEALRLRRQREMLRVEIEQLAAATKAARSELEQADGALHDTRLALQEAELRRTELNERVREELDIDLVEKYAEYDHTEQDWQAVEAEITELRDKIRRLGNVNLDAIAEQEELEQRHTFLVEQRDDLNDSQKQIEELIKQLDAESLQRFVEVFEAIRENFKDLFRKLFGGGKADIVLQDPDDILECGIDIVAKPPGKELQSITLMSGGEQAMTAIALLMSIFKSKPAPFALLDEVDAPLDEANNERFNRILIEFSEESQFIIITHSKRTMTIADRLYGVTMQEAGISTRVSVKFDGDDTQAVA